MSNVVGAEDDAKMQESGHGHSHDHAEGEVAKIVALGAVTVGGATFTIDREGQVEAGRTTEFGVEHIGGTPGVKPSSAWLENPDGTMPADPVKSEPHDSHWHFNVEPLDPVKKCKFVLQVGDEKAYVDFARGAQPSQDGILSVFKSPSDPDWRGFLELKLHGDAGDLELFLYATAGEQAWGRSSTGTTTPFDIPKETVVKLSFPSHGGKTIELRVRNDDKNEDEDGNPNMREGGVTNYFIFPGESGQDPAWLIGETVTSWRGLVSVAFEVAGKPFLADPFVLVPHDALHG